MGLTTPLLILKMAFLRSNNADVRGNCSTAMALMDALLLVAIGLINRLTNQQGDTRGACAKCGYREL